METSAAFAGPGFQEAGTEIRNALDIDIDSPIQRFTQAAEPLCKNQWDLFFGVTEYDEKGNDIPEIPHLRIARELTCIEICAVCPYRIRCLANILQVSQFEDRDGIFGGYTVKGRRKLRNWLRHQKVDRVIVNEELFWNIGFYEGRKAERDTLQYLKDQIVKRETI